MYKNYTLTHTCAHAAIFNLHFNHSTNIEISVFKNFRVKIILYGPYFYKFKTPRIMISQHFINTKLTQSTVLVYYLLDMVLSVRLPCKNLVIWPCETWIPLISSFQLQ